MASLEVQVGKTFQGYRFYVFEGCYRQSVVSLIQYGRGKISETLDRDTIQIARICSDVPNEMKKYEVLALDFITDSLLKGCMLYPRRYILCQDYKYPPTFAPNFRRFYDESMAEYREQSQPSGERDDNTNSGSVIKPGVSEKPSCSPTVYEIFDSDEDMNTSEHQSVTDYDVNEEEPVMTIKRRVNPKKKRGVIYCSDREEFESEGVNTSKQKKCVCDSDKEPRVSKKTTNLQEINTNNEQENTSKQLDDKGDSNDETSTFQKVNSINDYDDRVITSKRREKNSNREKVNTIDDSNEDVSTPKSQDYDNEGDPEVSKKTCNLQKTNVINDCDGLKPSKRLPRDDKGYNQDYELKISNKPRKNTKEINVLPDSVDEVHTWEPQYYEGDDEDSVVLEVSNQPKKNATVNTIRPQDSVEKLSKTKQDSKVTERPNEEEPTGRTRNLTNTNRSNDPCVNVATHSRWLNTESSSSAIQPEWDEIPGSAEVVTSEAACDKPKKAVYLCQSFNDRKERQRRFRENSRPVERTQSDEEFINEAHELAVPTKLPFRHPFSVNEKNAIVCYIRDNKLHSQVKGNRMWQRMARIHVVPGRTWHSLHEHFKKQILPRIEKYEKILGKEELQLFLNVRNKTECRPIPQSEHKRLDFFKPKRTLQEKTNVATASTSKYSHGTKTDAEAGSSSRDVSATRPEEEEVFHSTTRSGRSLRSPSPPVVSTYHVSTRSRCKAAAVHEDERDDREDSDGGGSPLQKRSRATPSPVAYLGSPTTSPVPSSHDFVKFRQPKDAGQVELGRDRETQPL